MDMDLATHDPDTTRERLAVAVYLMLSRRDVPHVISIDADGRARVYPSGTAGCHGDAPYRVLTGTTALLDRAKGLADTLGVPLPQPGAQAADWRFLAELTAGDLLEDVQRLREELRCPPGGHPGD